MRKTLKEQYSYIYALVCLSCEQEDALVKNSLSREGLRRAYMYILNACNAVGFFFEKHIKYTKGADFAHFIREAFGLRRFSPPTDPVEQVARFELN